jgi:hypothetical protein
MAPVFFNVCNSVHCSIGVLSFVVCMQVGLHVVDAVCYRGISRMLNQQSHALCIEGLSKAP